MSEIANINDAESARGLTRRQVTLGAAWSVPVVAIAVATPLAAASVVFDSPTAYVTGTLTATGTSSTARSAVYSGGALTYNSAGAPSLDSGELTITFYNSKTASWTLAGDIVTAYQTAGWTLVQSSAASTVFLHTAISNGQSIQMPSVTWNAPSGSTKPLLGIQVSSDADDVSGLGLALN